MMKFEEAFKNLKERFINKDASNIEDIAIQFNMTGKPAGVFCVKVRDGKLSIEPYEYIDNDVKITGTYKVFTKILDGKINPVSAFLIGRIKVTGDLSKAGTIEKILRNQYSWYKI